ncbi:hypothetical protein LTR97_010332 [Elasticomyces elasticus]|uniref:Uncharacterized protein n=1 Tax=Elasticomyces elasticus TaxID=574655 RepID=A0AAN7VY35_9PEZI|nr:hypothetical protein LTR97_010332 [Elasticomyces elasticus]
MENRDGTLSKLKRAGEDLERTAKRRGKMVDQSQRAVDAISQAWCKRAAGALSDMVLNENMLAEITTATTKLKMATGFNVELFLEALKDKMGWDDTPSTRDSHRYGMATGSGSSAQGHILGRTSEIETIDAVEEQPINSRTRGIGKPISAVAPQASHEQVMASGSGSAAQGHILQRTSEIEMPAPSMYGREQSLGTVAQGVDLYWCRRTLLKISSEEVKALMQQLFRSGRDVYIVNHIALAELEAHDALQSLDLQQLRQSAARAWAGETSKETDRYGVRHEMLVEGKAYVLSPTDVNNNRQRRRDEYGLIREMLSPAFIGLPGHDRTAQEQIEQYTTLEKAPSAFGLTRAANKKRVHSGLSRAGMASQAAGAAYQRRWSRKQAVRCAHDRRGQEESTKNARRLLGRILGVRI